MSRQPQLVVPVAELLRRPGAHRHVTTEAVARDLRVIDSEVPEGSLISVDVEIEAMTDGLMVTGQIETSWVAVCRRCLGPVEGSVSVTAREMHRHAVDDGEAFAFEGDLLDLEPMVRELVMAELPLAPVCRPDCAGLCPVCGADRNTGPCGHEGTPPDPRWGPLAALADDLARQGDGAPRADRDHG